MRIICNAKDSHILSTKNNVFVILPFEILTNRDLTTSLILNNCTQIFRQKKNQQSYKFLHFTDTDSHQQAVECLMVMIYSPYIPYLVKYKSYEEALLLKELNNIKLVSSD